MVVYAIKLGAGEDGVTYYADGQFDRCLPPNPYVTENVAEAVLWYNEADVHGFMRIFDRSYDDGSYELIEIVLHDAKELDKENEK